MKICALIDDESTFLRKFRLIFKQIGVGHSLDTFSSSKEMLDQFDKDKYHIILIDLNLRGSEYDGLQLARKLKKLDPLPRVYMISTSHGDRPWAVDNVKMEMNVAKSMGLSGWVVKGGIELISRMKTLFADIEKGTQKFTVYNQMN